MPNNDREQRPGLAPRLGGRELFPRLEASAYLNHAAISAPSAAAMEAMARWGQDFEARGALAYGVWAAQRDALRDDLATLIGARPDDIGFIANTMHGVNAVAFGFPWEAGDGVVVLEGEYPTNVVPWLRAAETFSLRVHRVSVDDFIQESIAWDAFESALESKPRLVAVSAVQFQTGLRMPLRAMAERCHAVGAQLFVDGVQACGATPIDVTTEGVDYLACGSHKWLMGVEGGGFLYVRPERMDDLRPKLTGGMSHQGALDLLFAGAGHLRYDRPLRKDVRVFEGGMLGGPSLAALGVSVQLINALGTKAIYDHVQRLHDAIEPELVARGFKSFRHTALDRRSCILSLRPPAGVAATPLCTALAERGVVCSSPDGLLRLSPHWPNAPTEIPILLDAIDAARD